MVIRNHPSIARAAALTSHEKITFSMMLYHASPWYYPWSIGMIYYRF